MKEKRDTAKYDPYANAWTMGEVLRLRYLKEKNYTHAKIGSILGRTKGAVDQQIHRLKKKKREKGKE